MRTPLRVLAITGGIASGKSYVADQLVALGVPLVDTDLLAREVVAPNSEGLAELIASFGSEILDASQGLNRRRLRELVFADPVARHKLEAITHPRIRALAQERTEQALEQTQPSYVVLAIPLLRVSSNYQFVDQVLVVDCQVHSQISRLVRRDGIDRELAEKMVAAQISREERLAFANHVLVNELHLHGGTGGFPDLEPAITRLHQRLLGMT